MSNKISKKDFLKVSFSSFLFLFFGGFGLINSLLKTNIQSPAEKGSELNSQEKSRYGASGYGV